MSVGRITAWTVLGVLLGGGLWVLYRFPPEQNGFYPRCVFHAATGWQCPGCGGLRAAHSLLHGRVAEAWHFNPLAVLLVPLAVLGVGLWALKRVTGWILFGWIRGSVWWWIAAGAFVVFGIGRNLFVPR